MEKQFDFNNKFKEAKTPEYRYTIYKLHVIGWSIDLSTNNMITTLQQARIQTIANDVCNLEYFPDQKFHKMQFCALPYLPTAHITEVTIFKFKK